MVSPKISVIMSVYNEPEKYIKESIESILKQTYKNFEFIIILDNPNNITAEKIIKDYAMVDERIKFIKNSINLGAAGARNVGILCAKGKYIAIMDADDIAFPEKLEKQINYIENNNIDLVGSLALFIDKDGNILNKKSNSQFLKDQEIKKQIFIGNPFIHSTILFKKEKIFDVGVYNPLYPLAEDYDFLLRFCAKCKVEIINEVLLYYRVDYEKFKKKKPLESKWAFKLRLNAFLNYGYNSKRNLFHLIKSFISTYFISYKIKEKLKNIF